MAACAALLVGAWKVVPAWAAVPGQSVADSSQVSGSLQSGAAEPDPIQGGEAESALPRLNYGSQDGMSSDAASIALPEGSFIRDLTEGDLSALLGGEDILCTRLGWGDAAVSGYCIFTPEGKSWEVTLTGRHIAGGAEDFYAVLTLAPDTLPLPCAVSPADGVTLCWGVEVVGRRGGTYGEGANREVWLPESREVEFLAHGVGCRLTVYGREGEGELAETIASRFVRYMIADGGVDLDCLTVAPENIPAWRNASFDTLAQARQEADFAPYLPAAELEGYGEFYGSLSYQEGWENTLFVRWSRGYDDVEVCIYLGGLGKSCHLVDPDQPETYDLRRYPIPWCDSVPEVYRETVSDPTFRAEDMSLEIVEARGREHDTGGLRFSFEVLHPDGTVVSYQCSGLTAQQVWALVEETL
ncbi:MAG: hypothetical protein HFF50_00950 [Lawsonibacter sp.]|nr:hypothetical protein [Lawsonibacter sp.]